MLKYIAIFLGIPLGLCGFFVFNYAAAANLDIVINEIGAYPSNTHEWVEIYNKGNEPIDLTGWKFWENSTNHGLTASTTDSIVAPGEYAAIVQDETQFFVDNPNFVGSVFDSSWSSLSENGEEIGLKDSSGNFMEQFTYLSTPNHHSLERRDATLADYTANNWQENVSENSLGLTNSNFGSSSSSSTPPENNLPTTSSIWAKLKINEFLPNPSSGNEWIELYNPTTSSLDLAGGVLCDGRSGTCTIATLSGTINPLGWLVINLSSSHLNNTGDSIILKNPDNVIIDTITYSGSLVPETDQTLARKIDGADTNNDTADWAITTSPTPGNANIISPPPPPTNSNTTSNGGGSGGTSSNRPTSASSLIVNKPPTTTPIVWATSTSPLIINELFPDPETSDLTDEFIELKNISSSTVNLVGWKLADNSKTFSLIGTIAPGKLIAFSRPQTGIALNNTTAEEIKLTNPAGAIADEIHYDTAEEGLSYNRKNDGAWHWSETITKETENILNIGDTVGILWKLIAPKEAAPGDIINFDASKSVDPRGGRINFTWKFNDGTIRTGSDASQRFATSGIYTILIFASSTAGTTANKKVSITIGDGLHFVEEGVVVSELFPNPHGTDTEEFIELYNTASTTIDLSSWQLKNKTNKIFTIPDLTKIPSHETLVFYRLATHLALDNNGDSVELLSPENTSKDYIEYTKSIDGQSFSRVGNTWVWTSNPSPGRIILQIENTGFPDTSSSRTKTTLASLKNPTTIQGRSKGSWIKVNGLVTASPGTFSDHSFYVSDGTNGVQIYAAKKIFPELLPGDHVAVAGTVSELKGVPRLLVKNTNDVDILATNGVLSPETVSLDELDDSIVHNLITIQGEITKLTSQRMYLDDGNDEIAVLFKPGAHISRDLLTVGENVQVTGIVEHPESGWQLWPRNNDDIKILGPSESEIKKQAEIAAKKSQQTKILYTAITVGGAGLLGVAWFIKKNGKIL